MGFLTKIQRTISKKGKIINSLKKILKYKTPKKYVVHKVMKSKLEIASQVFERSIFPKFILFGQLGEKKPGGLQK